MFRILSVVISLCLQLEKTKKSDCFLEKNENLALNKVNSYKNLFFYHVIVKINSMSSVTHLRYFIFLIIHERIHF